MFYSVGKIVYGELDSGIEGAGMHPALVLIIHGMFVSGITGAHV